MKTARSLDQNKKHLLLNTIICILFCMLFCDLAAQNYRTPKAYITDFGKNELYLKESLFEYTKTIIDASPDSRTQATLDRLYIKLAEINENLLKNDNGINGDTVLRDAFIKLNTKTIKLLKNHSLILNDYEAQSKLDFSEILKNFTIKELEIERYYADIAAYENLKREFGLKYDIYIRYNNRSNLFEYNAYENLIFYKLNVLDEKLENLLKHNDVTEVQQCLNYIDLFGKESLVKTEFYKDDVKDTSLNDANIEIIKFIMQQKETLFPIYEDYVKSYNELQISKKKFEENYNAISSDEYNHLEVTYFNKSKSNYYDTLNKIQTKKKEIINKWYTVNSTFLKNNLENENIFEKYIEKE